MANKMTGAGVAVANGEATFVIIGSLKLTAPRASAFYAAIDRKRNYKKGDRVEVKGFGGVTEWICAEIIGG